MKNVLLTTLLALFAAAASAQTGAVTGRIVDADTGESVVGAVLTVTPARNPEKKQYLTSAYEGSVSIPSLSYGDGEIMVGVNDMFNQNKAFARTTGSGWTQNATNSVIGRYYMVQFTYNLRRFGKKGSTNIKDYDGMEHLEGRRRMGPGGPGGPPPFRPR